MLDTLAVMDVGAPAVARAFRSLRALCQKHCCELLFGAARENMARRARTFKNTRLSSAHCWQWPQPYSPHIDTHRSGQCYSAFCAGQQQSYATRGRCKIILEGILNMAY